MRNHVQKNAVYAFIDSQNLNLSIQKMGWKLDFRKFRIYLTEKHGVNKVFLFLGFIPTNQAMYDALIKYGYELIFKPVLLHKSGVVKGNCDAELVLQAMIEYTNYHKAIIATGDGDFSCLIKLLNEKNKLERLLIPNKLKYSKLLKDVLLNNRKITFMNDLKEKLSHQSPKK